MDEVQAVASKVDDLQKGTLSKEQKGEALGKLTARLQKLKRRVRTGDGHRRFASLALACLTLSFRAQGGTDR